MCAIAILLSGVSLSSCSTAYRYEYYDYKGKTIDEKNDGRMDKINKKFEGMMSSVGTGEGLKSQSA